MKRLKDAVLRIDKDFMNYAGLDDIDEYEKLNDYFICHLEHELDIYDECKELELENTSWITDKIKKRVERIIDNYYNDKYIEE